MHKLIDYICDELESIEKKAEKGDLSMSELQYADTLAHLKKNLLKSEEMMEEFDEGYSSEMRPDGMPFNRSYRGGSYAMRRRDSMGRYSRDSEMFVEELRGIMRTAPDQKTRTEIERLVKKMEHM